MVLSSQIVENQSLKSLNWWRVGGVAEFFVAPTNIVELKSAWHWAWKNKLKVWVISGGSNVLIQEGVLKGLTISLHSMAGVLEVASGVERVGVFGAARVGGNAAHSAADITSGATHVEVDTESAAHDLKSGRVSIRCLAGTAKSEIAKIFMQNRLPPAVFLTGIPGDMGAGVVMNAGIGETRTPREFCEIVESILVLRLDEASGEFSEVLVKGADIKWEYRHSTGWQPGIIVEVTVGWANQPDMNVTNEVRAQTKKRVSTQPLDLPNCGSVFRNPAGHKSAQLIESCGLKGFRIGGASVSQKHANFIVNDQGANANDIKKIIEHVRDTVFAQHGVRLVTEVVFIGDV